MKTKLLIAAGMGACALAWAAKDPVIMTVNGVDVPKSEFEYLYHKNSQQQLSPQPLSEYVEMFVNYRLKVADAKAAGIDTTASFRQEMAQYRHELAQPYLADSVYLNKLVEEAWQRSREEVPTSHIMIFKSPDTSANERGVALLDSLRGVIAAGGDFAELAGKYSQDRGTISRGGSLGYICQGRFPYSFEVAAYALTPGEVSEVVESPVGYHLIKTGEHRPARGQVRASHILLMNKKGGVAQDETMLKNRIDSIYDAAVANPGDFEQLAMQYSDDKGSARQGGLLPWFGTGQMVQEFEDVAFETPVNQISKPFQSQFGWHIIYKIDEKSAPSLAQMKSAELLRITNPQDERSGMVKLHQNETLGKKHKLQLNDKVIGEMRAYVANNGLDSLFYVNYSLPAAATSELLSIDKAPVSVGEFVTSLREARQADKGNALKFLNSNFDGFINRHLVSAEEEWLEANQADYRNLYHEYCNGSLLYEASVKNVWDPAAKDTEGLSKFFEEHRSDYSWKEPRAKGILVQAKNDSVASDVMRRFAELPAAEVLSTLRKEYKGEASFERVLAQKGANPMVDNLMFGGPEVEPTNSNYTLYFMLDGRVIDAPEEASDVKGQVTGDYQEALEEQWIKELREKYPVTVNQKVLKKVK